MATVTPRLNLPRPEPSDNVNLANHQALIDAIDNAAETPAGAQAKADAALQAAKAYTDAAEQAAIDWVRERGIGSPGQTIDDLNNATEPGRWYVAGSSTANTPDGLSWWTVLVAYRNSSNLAQIAFRTIGGATQTKIRFLSGGTWTEWGNIWTSFNLPNPETQAGAQAKANAALQAAKEWATSGNITIIPSIPDASTSGNSIPTGVTMFTITSGSSGYFYPYSLIVNFKTTNQRLTQWCFKNGDVSDGAAYRHWYSGKGWTPWYEVWDSNNLPSPARTNVENHFTSAQRIQNLLRFAATSESGIIQVGENSSDTNARLRIARSNTTASSIALMEIFSEEVKISGNTYTSSATPTGSGNGYFRNTYIHSANPSGGQNGDVWHQYS